ncbi:MAG TPA: efflux RND transporter periplasmic adaptor subunit [Candidatus Binataceae bacterium]|nr:efflux RND transporter periplasmic adaptor subunit [Candidatus Binataceae bacterium]
MDEDPRNYIAKPAGRFFVAGWVGAIALTLIATAGLVLARELWIGRQTSELEQEAELGPRVIVARASRSPGERHIKLPASIHGYIETPIYAKIAGYLKEIKVDKGDRVRKDQVLAILESPELDHLVENARANYQIAALTDGRNQQLVKQGVVAQQTADESHAAMVQAEATLRSNLATQAYEVIKAPFDGLVTARYVDPGALIPQATSPAGGGTPVVAMATLNPLRIYADMPQASAPFIKNGDAATVTVAEYPGREFKGTVTRHPEALAPATRTMLVEVDLDNPDLALYPGMYATAGFDVNVAAGAPRVPDDALIFRDGKAYVPIVRERTLHLAPVTLGYDNGEVVEVTRGIDENDLVALNVGQSAREGEKVQPVMQQAAEPR